MVLLLNIFFAILNGIFAIANKEEENYNVALFNAFVCGFCLMGSIMSYMNL